MFKIVNAQKLNDDVFRLDVEAPFVAKKAKQASLSLSDLMNRVSACLSLSLTLIQRLEQ